MTLLSPSQRQARLANTPAWRLPFTTDELIGWLGKGLKVPKEGWTARTFAQDGQRLMIALHRIGRLTQRKAVPHVARTVSRILNKQVETVTQRAVMRRKNVGDESLWLQAIEEVFREQHLEMLLQITPPIQSVMSQGYSKTSALLGQETRPDNPRIIEQGRHIAQRITNINETTRKVIERQVMHSVEQGLTVTETAEKLREVAPQINHHRSMTIARTELSNAWSNGSAASYLESDTVSHVSVIGCEAREENSPQFRGESTCNIENVPVTDLPALMEVGWHVNHTGTLIASGFRAL